MNCSRDGALLLFALIGLHSVRNGEAEEIPQPPAGGFGLVSFTKDIAPILLKRCQPCHGLMKPKGGYLVSCYEPAMEEVTPGSPDESKLFRLVIEENPRRRMPKDKEPLSVTQVALLKRWIEEGAKFDGPDPKAPLATLVPKTKPPDPPEVYRLPISVTALAYSPSGECLAASGYHEVNIWNADDGKLIRRIKSLAERTYTLAFRHDGSLLAAASGTPGEVGEVKLIDPAAGAVVKDLGSMSDVALGAAFNPAGTKLAACGADRSIRIYDVATGKEELVIEQHVDWVMAVAWNQDGTRIASASRDKTAKIFAAKSGELESTYVGHGQPVLGVAFSADGKQVFTSGRDHKIHVWNSAPTHATAMSEKPHDDKQIAVIGGFSHAVLALAVGDGMIFSCAADRVVRQHRADDRQLVRAFTGHADWVYAMTYCAGTHRLATGSYDGEVRVWNITDGSLVTAFKAAPGYPTASLPPLSQSAKK
ncbi:MAG: hypothetical protein HY717_14520 [Planctomycetes bacterium]|nr:hypothetical protein [Planctomycetota bacterium]